MSAFLENIASTSFSRKLAQFLVPHSSNNHHPYLIRHEALFAFAFLTILVQFFSSISVASTSNQVLGYATNINRADVINLVNQERQERGLTTLKESSLLDQSSSLKADHMFAQDYWAHYAPDGTSPWYFFKAVGYNYTWAGENLARGFSTSSGVVAGWMNSPSHRENMLNPNFTEMGIGVEDGILEGEETTLVVQHLGKSLGASTTTSTSGSTGSSGVTGKPEQVKDSLNPLGSKQVEPSATANVAEVNENIAAAASGGFSWSSFWRNLGVGQKITLSLLGLLVSVFAVDSFLIFRKGHERQNSHSLLHTGVLIILMVVLIRGAVGGVL